MNQDKAIEYQAKLLEAEQLIEKIKEIEFDTNKIEQELEKINETIQNKINENYKTFHNTTINIFLDESLILSYDKAILSLDKILNFLKLEYEEYYTIYNNAILLELDLKIINHNNISDYISKAKNLLQKLNQTKQIDYKLEKNIVEKVYNIVYKLLKLETVYNQGDELLNYIKQSNINTSYIYKCITDDLKKLPPKEKEKLQSLILTIRKEGFAQELYLNKELIANLAIFNNEELFSCAKEYIAEQCNEIKNYQNQIINLSKKERDTKQEIDNCLDYKQILSKKRLKKSLLLFGNIISLSLSSFGIYKSSEPFAIETTYETTTETYDSRNGNIKTETSYLPEMTEEVIIKEYLPWIEPGYFRDNYTREIYTYDATELEETYNDIRQYLNDSILSKGATMSSEIETENKISDDEIYTNNYYTIKRITQNLEASHKELDKVLHIIITTICILILILLDKLLISSIKKKYFSDLKKYKKDNNKQLKEAREKLIEYNNDLVSLIENYNQLYNRLLEEYDQLPTIVQNNKIIKKRIKEIEENNPIPK